MITPETLAAWREDPVRFVEDALVDWKTGLPFKTFPAQQRFLREAFKLTNDGRLRYTELVYSCPKRGRKTTLAAWALLYVTLVLAGEFSEGYATSNSREQPQASSSRQ